MFAIITFIVGFGGIIISNYYHNKLRYLKSVQKLNSKFNGPSYMIIEQKIFTPIRFNRMELLTKEAHVMKQIKQNMFVKFKSYRTSAHLIKGNIDTINIMDEIHNKYAVQVGESPLYITSASHKGNLVLSNKVTEGSFKDITYGVVANDDNYLVVGDFVNQSFVKNQNFRVEKNQTIEGLIKEETLNAHTYYEAGKYLLVLSLFIMMIEIYFYLN